MNAPGGLARKSVGTPSLWFFAVGASSPMTVLAGGVIATYAATGVVGVPLSFLLLAGALALTAVSYSLAQIRTGAEAGTTVSQYCAPPDEERPDARRFYCRSGA